MEITKKYYKVSEAAKILGISADKVRDYCHVEKNRFAFRPMKNGRPGQFLIDLEKLIAYIERPRQERTMYLFTSAENKRRLG